MKLLKEKKNRQVILIRFISHMRNFHSIFVREFELNLNNFNNLQVNCTRVGEMEKQNRNNMRPHSKQKFRINK